MVTISEPDPGLSEEPEDTSLDRAETRKRRFADRAKKKAKFRCRGSRQRVTMVTISEPDLGLSEEPEDTSLDREETRKRRFALWFHITVIVSIGLLSILLISLRFKLISSVFLCPVLDSPSPWREGREHLLDELDELTLQGWMLYDKSLYLVSTTKKGWRASREDCQKRKADLVVINSREEQAFVSRLMDTSWIGLSDRETEGTLKWVDGTPMTSSWRHVKPRDDGGVRDCVVAGEDGWSEEPCDRLHHWICEKVVDLDHLEAERNKEGSVMPTEEEAPSITEFHSSTHVLPVGQTARYTCHAGGTPEPTVEWLHNSRPLERGGTDDQSEAWVERGFLFVRGVRYGVNTVCCMASNSAATANHSAELLVFDACELTLDPNTAGRLLSLSEDNRKVTAVGDYHLYPDHPDRFQYQPQVLGKEALTDHCYWEVERERPVAIGVTYRGITRRGWVGDSTIGGNNKSWSLNCDDGGYSVMYNATQIYFPYPAAGSTRVGVYLDRPAGSLSFYRVSPGGGGSSDTLTLIHTFWSSFTQEDLLPGVGIWSIVGATATLCRL
uniref:B30.2/SPRY domain-containing protein n=1 Tax=Gadus morhua TaxID=8049 RepID=A0A8C4ZWI2_GADMO